MIPFFQTKLVFSDIQLSQSHRKYFWGIGHPNLTGIGCLGWLLDTQFQEYSIGNRLPSYIFLRKWSQDKTVIGHPVAQSHKSILHRSSGLMGIGHLGWELVTQFL